VPAKAQVVQPVASGALPGGTPRTVTLDPSNAGEPTTGTRNRGSQGGENNDAVSHVVASAAKQVVAGAPKQKDVLSARPAPPKPKRQVVHAVVQRRDPVIPAVADEEPRPAIVEDLAPIPVHRVKPLVPRALIERFSEQFVVRLRVSVDANGRVLRAAPLVQDVAMRPIADLAVQAGLLWTFSPARHNGVPVPGDAIIEFHFMPAQQTR